MSTLGLMLTLFMTLVFTSCQVKESSGGGLFSGHIPTTNKFTVQTPAAKIYLATETLTVNVTFPFDITLDTTGGTPRLRLTVGATTRYATFVPGADPKVLSFAYTFVNGDNDTNGIDVNALELQGSTMTFDKDGVATNCDVATVTTTNFPNVKVDTQAATISSLTFVNPVGQYTAGKTLTMKVTYAENVVVTGAPYFQVTFGAGGTHNLTYLSGSGSNSLLFSYVIGQSDYDINGYTFSNTIALNGGTIKDLAGINAELDLTSVVAAANAASANIDIVGTYPSVVDVDVPANGTYAANQTLDFVLEFDRNVTVTGTHLVLTLGTSPTTTTRQAQYYSGTGTRFITYRYVTVPGDVDTDGIQVATSITQDTGSITAGATSYFQVGNNLFTVPPTQDILLNAVQPMAINVTRNIDTSAAVWGTSVDNKWIIDQTLNITVGFNTQILVGQQNGTPYIPLTIGTTTRNATYLSGGDGQTSLVFTYTIQEGDLDTDGTIAVGSIVLNGGTITDMVLTNATLTLPVTGLTTTQIDGVRPVISNVTAPPNNTYSEVAGQNYQNMIFTVNWSEPVHYTNAGIISMDVGGASTPLQSYNNDVAAITHRPTATLAPKNDTDGVTIGSSVTGTVVRDQAGNQANTFTFTAPNTTNILVDTVAPTVISITPISASSTYKAGETVDFAVTFSESVTVAAVGGYPRIPMNVGGTTAYMVATTNGTNNTHTFRYSVVAPHMDSDGVAATNTVENTASGYVRDTGRNNATVGINVTMAGIKVDTTAPTITGVTRTTDGTYESGDNIDITLDYSEPVFVDTTDGTPRISVTIGSTTRYLTYNSGSGSSSLLFRYTLASTDFDGDGLPVISSLALNNGTILDEAGNPSPTTFTSQNLMNVLVAVPNTILWVDNNFQSLARSGSPAVTNGGLVSTEVCGTSACRTFDGDDSLTSGALTAVKVVYIVFKTPASPTWPDSHNLFSSNIRITVPFLTSSYDISTSTAAVNLDGTSYSSDTSFDVNMSGGSFHVLEVNFSSTQNISGTLIPTSFNGAIGEVIAVSGSPTGAQRTAILNYLNAKY